MATVIALAVIAGVISVSFTTLWLWRHQERVVFQPPVDAPDAPAPARRVAFPAADGHPLFGYLLDPPPGSPIGARVVIAFHGNADLSAWTAPWGHELAKRAGVTVFIPEYRGYGGIPGEPTYESAKSDARGALAYARDSLRATEVVIYGHSLGTAIGSELATHTDGVSLRALVLQSPFTSAQDMAKRMMVPAIPGLWSLISRVRYDTRTLVSQLDVPVFVSHGSRDLTIPVRMGRAVFAAARNPGELLVVEGAGHNDIADIAAERYWRWLVKAVSVN